MIAMRKKYIVRLTSKEREHLQAMVSKGKVAAYRIKHANILLAADVKGPGWPDRPDQPVRPDRNDLLQISVGPEVIVGGRREVRPGLAVRMLVGIDVVELAPIDGLVAPDFLVAQLTYKLIGYAIGSRTADRNSADRTERTRGG